MLMRSVKKKRKCQNIIRCLNMALYRGKNAIISLSTCIKSMSSLDELTVKIGINRSDRSSAVADPAGDRPV